MACPRASGPPIVSSSRSLATASACSSSASSPRCSPCDVPNSVCRGTTSRSRATTRRRSAPLAASVSYRRTRCGCWPAPARSSSPTGATSTSPAPAMLDALRAAHARGAADVGVLGRLRARRRGLARRPARHHPLAPRQQTAGEVPERPGRTVRALCGGRQRLHRRRQRRRHRPRTASGPSGLRLGDRQPGGAAHGRAAPPRGRAVAVRGHGDAGAGRIAGADHGMGERAARSAARRVDAGAQGPDVAPHAGPALRGPGRHHAAPVAHAPAGAGGAAAARDLATRRSNASPSCRGSPRRRRCGITSGAVSGRRPVAYRRRFAQSA